MTEIDWQQVWEVYRSAREMPPENSRAFLAGVDMKPELFEQVVLLLGKPDSSSTGHPEQDTSERESRTGKTFGRYRILSSVGRGGMGEVYAARDELLDRPVALKFIGGLWPEAALDGVLREAKAASALNYPNIVTVYEVVDLEEGSALVMELVEGSTLRELRRSARPLRDLLDLARQAAEALAAAHSHGIVHGDIKPDNIMVRADGIVKLVDFGLARHFAVQKTETDSFPAGTPQYMAPEQISGAPVTAASDIFSLGKVLSELCVGERRSPIPRVLDTLLKAMVKNHPENRPSSEEVAARLRQIWQSQAFQHGRPTRLQWLGSNVGVLMAAVLGFQLFHYGGDKKPSTPPSPPVVTFRRVPLPPSGNTPAAANAWQTSSKYLRILKSNRGARQSPRP